MKFKKLILNLLAFSILIGGFVFVFFNNKKIVEANTNLIYCVKIVDPKVSTTSVRIFDSNSKTYFFVDGNKYFVIDTGYACPSGYQAFPSDFNLNLLKYATDVPIVIGDGSSSATSSTSTIPYTDPYYVNNDLQAIYDSIIYGGQNYNYADPNYGVPNYNPQDYYNNPNYNPQDYYNNPNYNPQDYYNNPNYNNPNYNPQDYYNNPDYNNPNYNPQDYYNNPNYNNPNYNPQDYYNNPNYDGTNYDGSNYSRTGYNNNPNYSGNQNGNNINYQSLYMSPAFWNTLIKNDPSFTNGRFINLDPLDYPYCVNLTRNFGYGSRDADTGREVSALQGYLYSRGYMDVEPTGYFGNITAISLGKFQLRNQITVTGSVNPEVISIMKELTCIKIPRISYTDKPLSPSQYVTTTKTTVTNTTNTTAPKPTTPKPVTPPKEPVVIPSTDSKDVENDSGLSTLSSTEGNMYLSQRNTLYFIYKTKSP
ncbi:MAG: peptidoglycan-binding domain-containing protein, partial [Bacteroidaceae bacterium]|nr:peptidoglycan-binding domain-containing protein [Bacteroidaceae bacterium]